MLYLDGKGSYERAPVASTSDSSVLAIGGKVLFSSLTLVGRGIGLGLRRTRRASTVRSAAARFARSAASAFAGAVAVSTLGAVTFAGTIDPMLGQHRAAFGIQPAWSRLLTIPPALMVLAGLAVVPSTVVVWYRGPWTVVARVLSTVLAALALVFLPVLSYWNLP